ncbi:hypothetical protein Csa_006616 [Cucumis sativus]|uniref:Uncharacterized protein n=1 Tax=Cucumis sativus TaxID=3659 RepID=A0A0A0LJY2_CUCSA|nr:hypothetical protein Csa_006616 [Cucumis sativus]
MKGRFVNGHSPMPFVGFHFISLLTRAVISLFFFFHLLPKLLKSDYTLDFSSLSDLTSLPISQILNPHFILHSSFFSNLQTLRSCMIPPTRSLLLPLYNKLSTLFRDASTWVFRFQL